LGEVAVSAPGRRVFPWGGVSRGGGGGPRGDVSATVLPRSTVPLIFPSPFERLAVLDIAPEPGFEGSVLEIAVNLNLLGRFPLAEGRQRLSVTIPQSAQRPGRNRVRFLFPELEAKHPDRRRAPNVARVFSIVVGPASDPTLREVARPGSPPALTVTRAQGIPSLVQAGPSALRFALRVPEDGQLSFVPGAHERTPAGTALTLKVTTQQPGGNERQLWKGRLRAGETAAPVDLTLPGNPHSPLWLTLHAGEDGEAGGWAVWSALRVLGTAGGDPLEAGAVTSASHAGKDLASSLEGMNVLLVLFDAARARQLGCYGYPHPTTPELDRLAAAGVVFERHYTPAVFTYSAVGSIWTSQYPDQDQSEWLKNGMLPSDRMTLAELLTGSGIHTATFLASPSAGQAFGLDRGFAEVHDPWRRPRGEWTPVDAAIFRESLFPWIAQGPSEPFFAYVHYREPHTPFSQPPLFGPDEPLPEEARWNPWYGRANSGERPLTPGELDHLVRLYDGNLAFGDRELGALRQAMEAAGLWDRTVVIATSDHGEALFEHGYFGHNIQVYEESTHIPLIIRFPPAAGLKGVRVEELTSLVDLAPTVAHIQGVLGKGGSDRAFRGRSLLPLITRRGSGGAVVSRSVGVRPVYGFVTQRFKLIYNSYTGEEELYDLEADPGERVDLAEREPLWTAVHRQALQRWMLGLRSAELSRAEPAQLDEQAVEALRALGYVDE
jgi:arylsulfatase